MAGPLSLSSTVEVFSCPNCFETINTSIRKWPYCSSPIDSATALAAGAATSRISQACSDAILDPDLLESFPDSPSVNRALRAFLAINHQIQEAGTRIRGRRPAASAKPNFDPRVGVQPRQASR